MGGAKMAFAKKDDTNEAQTLHTLHAFFTSF